MAYLGEIFKNLNKILYLCLKMVDKQMEIFSRKSKVEGGKMLKNWLISHGLTHSK
jgi:hypothetical protein